ncbi:MAG: hypothetical protein ACYCZN_02010 [Candidatus Dormibacteria bacterium]
MAGLLSWPGHPYGQSLNAIGGHTMVKLASGASVSLADYLVVADYYQNVKLVPAVAAVPGTPAGPHGVPPAVLAKPATPARCVNSGGAQFKGLHPIPVCPQAGPALCAAPDPSSSQVGSMYNYVAAHLEQPLAGGAVTTVPAANALVGLATYGSLKGAVLPLYKTLSVITPSAQTWQGRALVLTLTATLSLTGVKWCWGDGVCTFEYGTEATGTPGRGSSVSYTYYDVSVHGEHPTPYPLISAKDQIPITAYAVEQLTATLSWIYPWGSVGSESLPSRTAYVPAVGAGVTSALTSPPSPALLQAHAAWVRVLQAEGIPYCPSPTNCS